jgi:hypothetical protein
MYLDEPYSNSCNVGPELPFYSYSKLLTFTY